MMTTSEKATQKSSIGLRLSVHQSSCLWALSKGFVPDTTQRSWRVAAPVSHFRRS